MKNYTLKELIRMFWKSMCLIIVLAIIGGGAMGVYAKHKQTTTYTATRYVVITHNLNNVRSNDDNPYDTRVNADINMMPTYADIAENKNISVQAHKYLSSKLQKKYSVDELNETIDGEPHQQSLVLTLKSKTNSPQDSVDIVNATAKAFQKQLPKIQPGVGRIVLLEKPTPKTVNAITKPGLKKYVAVGLALGALLGIIISFILITFKDIAKKAGQSKD